MITYEYICKNCKKHQFIQHSIKKDLKDCPLCGATDSLEIIISPSTFILKGTGWYQTDYRKGSNNVSN